MAVQIRYISRPENTMTITEAIAKGTDVPAVSSTDEPELKQRAGMRFPDGPPYASIMAAELRAYAKRLRRDMIHRVILVARSSGVEAGRAGAKKNLLHQGIPVNHDYFYTHVFHIQGRIAAAMTFGKEEAG